jgi:RNA recognition motif-containing protein
MFAGTGTQVEELTMPRDRTTGRPRGFAFVRLASPEQAESARGTLDGTLLQGRSISVRPFSAEPPRRGEGGPSTGPRPGGGYAGGGGGGGGGGSGPGGPRPDTSDRTLYVGNLPYESTEQDVKDLFAELGAAPPQRVHLPADAEGRKRGFGFVTLATSEEANAALEKLREAQVRGRRLVVNIAHPKGDRPPRAPGDRPSFGGGFGGGGGMGGGGAPGGPPGGPFVEERRGTRKPFPPPGATDGAPAPAYKGSNKKRRPTEPKGAAKKRGGRWDDEDY